VAWSDACIGWRRHPRKVSRWHVAKMPVAGNLCRTVASEGRLRDAGALQVERTRQYVSIASTAGTQAAERSRLFRGSGRRDHVDFYSRTARQRCHANGRARRIRFVEILLHDLVDRAEIAKVCHVD